jgi:hypothetical protein
MDESNQGILIICAALLLFFFGVFGIIAYETALRAEVINNSPDPLYAACAFDSSGRNLPPSCFALITQDKELPR